MPEADQSCVYLVVVILFWQHQCAWLEYPGQISSLYRFCQEEVLGIVR